MGPPAHRAAPSVRWFSGAGHRGTWWAIDPATLAAVLLLAAAHLLAPMLAFIRFEPRSWALSAAGGVSVAYVFVHLLPEVAEAQEAVEPGATSVLAGFERHAYVLALLGLAVFYGLERAAIDSKDPRRAAGAESEPTTGGAFWISMASFAIYNAVVGYLVVRRAEADGISSAAVFVLALALHFVINDLGLRHHHRRRYDRFGRPILVVAILVGWLVGSLMELSEAALGLGVAFLAGGIVLNVLKEELPEERQSRFFPLALGMAGYTALLLAV